MKTKLIPVILFAAFSVLFFSNCNTADSPVPPPQDTITPAPAVKEDPVITKLRPVLFNLQNAELSYNGRKPFDLTISNIYYTLISYKQYYTEQLVSLQAQAKYSTDKEKTQKALDYLSKMIKQSTVSEDLFKVGFHLKAQVDKTNYDTEKILYLKNDLTLLQLIFPQ